MGSASSAASSTLATRTLLLCGPGKLLLRTLGECDLDPEHLLEVFGEQRQRFEVFGEQRQRFVAILAGFGPGDSAAPTRCAD